MSETSQVTLSSGGVGDDSDSFKYIFSFNLRCSLKASLSAS